MQEFHEKTCKKALNFSWNIRGYNDLLFLFENNCYKLSLNFHEITSYSILDNVKKRAIFEIFPMLLRIWDKINFHLKNFRAVNWVYRRNYRRKRSFFTSRFPRPYYIKISMLNFTNFWSEKLPICQLFTILCINFSSRWR